MSDLKVSLILQLKNLLKGGLGQVRGDLKGLKSEAQGLSSIKGPDASGLSRYGAEARRSAMALRELKREQMVLGRGIGPSNMALGGTGLAARAVGGIGMGALSGGVAAFLAASQLREATKIAAERERAMTRIAVTGDASRSQQQQAAQDIERLAAKTTLASKDIREGLDSLVAAGRSLPDAMKFLPSVASTAQASGAAVLDIAKSADAVSGSMEVAADRMQSAFDIMATGGKLGKFELKDMAQFLPELAPMAKEAGMKGEEGLKSLVAALQMVRKETGTSSEAATNLKNVFSKMFTNETEKKFEKMGVDLPKEMEKAKKAGKNLLDTFVDLSVLATKGDMTKLPKLFEDMQAQSGMRALINNRKAMKDMVGEIGRTAEGTVGRDLNRVLGDSQSAMDKVANSAGRFGKNIGDIINSSRAASGILGAMAGALEKVNEALERKGEIDRKLAEAGVKPLPKLKTAAEAEADALLGRQPISDDDLRDMQDGGFHRRAPKDSRSAVQKAEDALAETQRARQALKDAEVADQRKRAGRDVAGRAKEADDIRKGTGAIGEASGYVKDQTHQQRTNGPTPQVLGKINDRLEGQLSDILGLLNKGGLSPRVETNKRAEAEMLIRQILNNQKRVSGGGAEASDAEVGKVLLQRLEEIKSKAKETGDAVKTNLTMDLTSQGAAVASTFAAGITSGGGAAVSAAASIAARVRAQMNPAASASMSPPATPGAVRPVTGGGATGPRSTNVQVAGIHIHGVSDPDRAAKRAVSELAGALRSSLSGAHHDGVA